MFKWIKFMLLALLLAGFSPPAHGQEKGRPPGPPGPPPAPVVVGGVGKGSIAPQGEFVGTVYYREVSDIAAEVPGKVEAVRFEEGRRVKKGEALVEIDKALLLKDIEAVRGTYEEALTELEKAVIDLERVENLYRQELVSQSEYDSRRFAVAGLEKKASSLKASLGRMEVELRKKTVRAPYGGVIIRKKVDAGEWVQPGTPVGTIAGDDFVDIVVNVPEEVTRFTAVGASVEAASGGKKLKGTVIAVIPSGDVPTRTFPVKVRARNTEALAEGMEARVRLPVGKKTEALIVNRDAVATVFGMEAVFAVVDGTAKMVPVKVLGYEGKNAGVASEVLKPGMKVVIKGNERLRDGQPVNITGEK